MDNAETLSGVVFDDPTDVENSSRAGGSGGPDNANGSTPVVEGKEQPALSAYEARLVELERTNQRHREQMAGSQQEVQRLLDHNKLLSQQNTEFLTAFRDLLKPPAAANGTQSAATTPDPAISAQELDLSMALEKAVVDGDYSEVKHIQRQLGALLNSLTTRREPPPDTMKPEQIQELIRTELSRTTNQQQTYQRIVSAISRNHPFLADPKDQLYAEVWQAYDDEAKDPFMQEAYGDGGGRFTVDMPAPAGQGRGSKPMDMRILDRVALQVEARHATTQARRQTDERRESPTLDTTGRQPPSGRTPSMLFTKGEIANMQELLRLGVRGPNGTMKSMDEFRKYRWEKLIATDEKQRRLDLWRAGKWE
mgnify:CR=1 FL=1